MEKQLESEGIRITVSHVEFPRDGRTPDELISKISAGVDVAGHELGSGIVLDDPAMRQLDTLVGRVAPSTINVLLLGETGVGKEVFAERLHERSARSSNPLLRLNCAALSESLVESELFGHERGAFTGAVASKPGLLEQAEGGTVFLDEVGDLPTAVQVKLLRVLEDRQVLRVGALKPLTIDVRFIAATHRDLEEMVSRGEFRQDLYFRLNGITLVIPPLRERRSEIPRLARAFADLACSREVRPGAGVLPRGRDAAARVPVAGQRPRAPQRDRAGSLTAKCCVVLTPLAACSPLELDQVRFHIESPPDPPPAPSTPVAAEMARFAKESSGRPRLTGKTARALPT